MAEASDHAGKIDDTKPRANGLQVCTMGKLASCRELGAVACVMLTDNAAFVMSASQLVHVLVLRVWMPQSCNRVLKGPTALGAQGWTPLPGSNAGTQNMCLTRVLINGRVQHLA